MVSIFPPLDKASGYLSLIMHGAVVVQIGYQSMEIMDIVDFFPPYLSSVWT